MTLIDDMSLRALHLGIPFSAHVDVTYRCNERCVHCYLDHDDHGEMTTTEIKNVLDQLAAAGTFFLTLTSGAILTPLDFFEILDDAPKTLFYVRTKNNGLSISVDEARSI